MSLSITLAQFSTSPNSYQCQIKKNILFIILKSYFVVSIWCGLFSISDTQTLEQHGKVVKEIQWYWSLENTFIALLNLEYIVIHLLVSRTNWALCSCNANISASMDLWFSYTRVTLSFTSTITVSVNNSTHSSATFLARTKVQKGKNKDQQTKQRSTNKTKVNYDFHQHVSFWSDSFCFMWSWSKLFKINSWLIVVNQGKKNKTKQKQKVF